MLGSVVKEFISKVLNGVVLLIVNLKMFEYVLGRM